MPQPNMSSKFKTTDNLLKEARQVADKAAQVATREWMNIDPANRGQIAVKSVNYAYKKSPVSFFKIASALLDETLLSTSSNKYQKEILAEVQKLFPQVTLNQNSWNRPLIPSLKAKLQARIDGNMAKPISIKACNTLAHIRKTLKANPKTKGTAKSFTATFTFTNTELIVGKKSYAYTNRRSGQTKVQFVHLPLLRPANKRAWVRVSALAALVAVKPRRRRKVT